MEAKSSRLAAYLNEPILAGNCRTGPATWQVFHSHLMNGWRAINLSKQHNMQMIQLPTAGWKSHNLISVFSVGFSADRSASVRKQSNYALLYLLHKHRIHQIAGRDTRAMRLKCPGAVSVCWAPMRVPSMLIGARATPAQVAIIVINLPDLSGGRWSNASNAELAHSRSSRSIGRIVAANGGLEGQSSRQTDLGYRLANLPITWLNW